MPSAATQRIFIDLKPIVSIDEKLDTLYGILSEVDGFVSLYWGYTVGSLSRMEILLRKHPISRATSTVLFFN